MFRCQKLKKMLNDLPKSEKEKMRELLEDYRETGDEKLLKQIDRKIERKKNKKKKDKIKEEYEQELLEAIRTVLERWSPLPRHETLDFLNRLEIRKGDIFLRSDLDISFMTIKGFEIGYFPSLIHEIGGDLRATNVKIDSLPEGLTVKRDLDLQNTDIDRLPENLTVKEDLEIMGTNINKLPDNFEVEGNIVITEGDEEQLSQAKQARKEGKIKGEIQPW